MGLFSTPFWSALCDYLQRKRLVLSVLLAGGAASALLYLLPLILTTTALNGVLVPRHCFLPHPDRYSHRLCTDIPTDCVPQSVRT